MARTKPPSFDFFPDDFIAGTYHLPAESVGIYVRLLCYQWNNGSIPSDESELARIAGVDANAMRTHMRTVMLKFMPDGCGGLKNERLEKERMHKLSIIEKAKASADRRWANKKPGNQQNQGDSSSCGGNANAYANGHANAYANAMLPTSNVLLPTSNDKTPLTPQGGGVVVSEEKPKQPEQPAGDPQPKRTRKTQETIGEFQIPKRLDTPEVRKALKDFETMRIRTGKRIRDRGNVCRGWDARFVDVAHLLACIDITIANEWQGIDPKYVAVGQASFGRPERKTTEVPAHRRF
jgi:uncharacterized protein YdaU (DUF1376 family)